MEIKLILTYLKIPAHPTNLPLSPYWKWSLSYKPKCGIQVVIKRYFSGLKPLAENTHSTEVKVANLKSNTLTQ